MILLRTFSLKSDLFGTERIREPEVWNMTIEVSPKIKEKKYYLFRLLGLKKAFFLSFLLRRQRRSFVQAYIESKLLRGSKKFKLPITNSLMAFKTQIKIILTPFELSLSIIIVVVWINFNVNIWLHSKDWWRLTRGYAHLVDLLFLKHDIHSSNRCISKCYLL